MGVLSRFQAEADVSDACICMHNNFDVTLPVIVGFLRHKYLESVQNEPEEENRSSLIKNVMALLDMFTIEL